ncbi:MAG: arginine--tRNA ligase [Acidimicrobiales bacterium]|nr:arginine--tRNA ligase [Acidimicrobiales bacterium]
MTDPQVVLEQRFSDAIVALGPDAAGADPVVRPSQRADYQVNGAMALGKRLGRSPREVADALVATADLEGIAARVEVAGPGFINIDLSDEFLVRCLSDVRLPMRGVRQLKAPETVVIDYSAPNVAKEMHVGHLRSTVIGDAIARILEFVGDAVIRHNHLGDWGTPFGMLIEHLVDLGEQEAAAELSVGDLNTFYQDARKKFDADPSFAERARQRVVKLQAGDPDTLAKWRLLVEQSEAYFSNIYERLGVTLTDDDYKGESTYNDELPSIVDELRAKGLLVEDQGALCVFPPGFEGRDGEPLPVIVQKSDGGFGYAATDLAAIRHRIVELGATWAIYVVGAPQAEHLAMVFEVARMAGWLVPPARAEHVAFGSVLGSDGKIFRTRSGESIKLADLLDEAEARALEVVREKSPELSEEEHRSIARAVGIGAIKYADLSSDRVNDYVFDWDRMLSFSGNTAPYLQGAHARVRSIFRKAGLNEPAETDPVQVIIAHPAERALVRQLLMFDGAVQAVLDSLKPHRLCTYLFELAQGFATFYEECPVLRAETEELRSSRLDLCDLTARVMKTGLDLLGIPAPDRI